MMVTGVMRSSRRVGGPSSTSTSGTGRKAATGKCSRRVTEPGDASRGSPSRPGLSSAATLTSGRDFAAANTYHRLQPPPRARRSFAVGSPASAVAVLPSETALTPHLAQPSQREGQPDDDADTTAYQRVQT